MRARLRVASCSAASAVMLAVRNSCSRAVNESGSAHSRASASRAPRYSPPSSRSSASHAAVASVSWWCTRRPSRLSSSHRRSRGQLRINASCVRSTALSSNVTSRAAASCSSTVAVCGSSSSVLRATRRLVSSVPSPSAVSRSMILRATACCARTSDV
ncbi:hypothetical protein FKR81_18390 [Lentzea tibetensis]|uniref:Secreted protein n=1 Tax=Lentzea tibetensis TaxID=2591470 RepID=A0A563ETI8_9PSEU|nr:hypothetical protein [Lentzea tibetensis]TWP51037.1 hypothetical protein FKR81_18390 [Lentzea tibetensis]